MENQDGQKGPVKDFRDLRVYQLAMEGAMEIYELSKKFPPEERYSLTDQIRRCSRSEDADANRQARAQLPEISGCGR